MQIIELETIEAERFEERYVCSTRWGNLTHEWIGRVNGIHMSKVHCVNENCSRRGFVTRRYAERRREQSFFDYLDAKRNIGKILGIVDETPVNITKALKDLGF